MSVFTVMSMLAIEIFAMFMIGMHMPCFLYHSKWSLRLCCHDIHLHIYVYMFIYEYYSSCPMKCKEVFDHFNV